MEIEKKRSLIRRQIERLHASKPEVICVTWDDEILPGIEATGPAVRRQSLRHDKNRVRYVVSVFWEEVHTLVRKNEYMISAIIP